MNKYFGFSLFSIGISAAGLLTMLFMLMMMIPSSVAGYEFSIYLTVDGRSFNEVGEPYTVKVEKTHSVETLKWKIRHEIGILPKRQTLRHNNQFAIVLKDEETMMVYGIKKDHTIYVAIDEFKIYATRKHSKERYTVWVSSMDTVTTLEEKFKAVYEDANRCDCLSFMLKKGPRGYKVWDAATMDELGIEKGSFVVLESRNCNYGL
ncbi:hypothetical protein niasHS_018126 [Heterodera schachtii]|uniref:Ubiquitin-like domain-containing protein n=1 Tax=Heterodera schachtii TaxID=97005 RepID=A0ABD2HWL6_HETSC